MVNVEQGWRGILSKERFVQNRFHFDPVSHKTDAKYPLGYVPPGALLKLNIKN